MVGYGKTLCAIAVGIRRRFEIVGMSGLIARGEESHSDACAFLRMQGKGRGGLISG